MHILGLNYIFFSVILLALLISRGVRLDNKRNELPFIALSFFVLAIFHVFVDINSVEDLPGYEIGFKEISQKPFKNIFGVFRKGDPFYAIFNAIISFFSSDFGFFLLIYNVILLISHYIIFNKYSTSVSVSVLVFLAITYNQSIFVIRQYLAISFLFFSIPFIINRKIVPFLFLCALAFFTHSSALLFVPLYFIYGVKNKIILISLLACAALFLFLIHEDLENFLIIFNVSYEEYLDVDNDRNLTAKLIPVSYWLCYMLAVRRNVFDEGINRLCFIALTFYVIGYSLAPSVGLIERIMKYFEIFVMFAVPVTMSYIKNAAIRILYLLSVLIMQGYLAINNLSEFYYSDYKISTLNIEYLTLLIAVDIILVIYIKNKSFIPAPKKNIIDTTAILCKKKKY